MLFFLDPLLHSGEQFPSQTWGYVRAFARTVYFCANHGGFTSVGPTCITWGMYGYLKLVADFIFRLKLLQQVVHAEFLRSCVSHTRLSRHFPAWVCCGLPIQWITFSTLNVNQSVRNFKYQRRKCKTTDIN